MGRKNSNVRRSNDKGRRARALESAMPKRKVPSGRERLEDLIIPDGKCLDHGIRPTAYFIGESKAAQALARARKRRERIGSGHVEKRYYQCPVHPERWHLTSRETYESRERP